MENRQIKMMVIFMNLETFHEVCATTAQVLPVLQTSPELSSMSTGPSSAGVLLS